MVTGHASVPKAVEAMQQGAFNFLEKPLNLDRLRAVTEKAADAVRLLQANLNLHQRLDEKFGFEGIIYSSRQDGKSHRSSPATRSDRRQRADHG